MTKTSTSILIFISIFLLIPIVQAIDINLEVLPSIGINISYPQNTTYTLGSSVNSIDVKFSATDSNATSFIVRVYLNGNLFYENLSFENSTSIATPANITSSGDYNLTITGEDLYTKGQSYVLFTIIKQTEPIKIFVKSLIPTIMSGGTLIWLVALFIGSPKNPEELINYIILATIVVFLLVVGINIIVGLV